MRLFGTALVVVAVVAGCRDGGTQYSRSDVTRAFRSEGIQLVTLTSRLAMPDTRVVFLKKKDGEDMLAPNSGGPFFVLLFNSEKRAAFAFQTLTSQTTRDTFELRKRNIVVTSDEGVTPEIRKRIRRALSRLAA
jgi:hypothetical protein